MKGPKYQRRPAHTYRPCLISSSSRRSCSPVPLPRADGHPFPRASTCRGRGSWCLPSHMRRHALASRGLRRLTASWPRDRSLASAFVAPGPCRLRLTSSSACTRRVFRGGPACTGPKLGEATFSWLPRWSRVPESAFSG
jgi:hypothetical protein